MSNSRKPNEFEQFTVEAALGRIFGLMSRKHQPSDVEEYERCRAAVLDILEPAPSPLGHVTIGESSTPNYIRDRRKGT